MIYHFVQNINQHSTPRKRIIRIGLLGMYTGQNLGDTAIQAVVMSALRARQTNVQFIGLSHDADDVVKTHGIPGFPASGHGILVMPASESFHDFRIDTIASKKDTNWLGRLKYISKFILRPFLPLFLRNFFLFSLQTFRAFRNIERQMQSLDILIISGGGQIDDFWGGPWKQPFHLFMWCMSAKRNKKPIASFAIGVDDLNSKISIWLVIHALRMAQYRTFRDIGSLNILQDLGLDTAASVCPDPAFGYNTYFAASRTVIPRRTAKYAVMSLIAKGAYPGMTDAEYDDYLNILATVAKALLKAGLKLRFVCSQIKMDPPAISHLMVRIGATDEVSIAEVKTVDDFLVAVKDAELVVASRLHSLILSLVAGTPIVALASARKVRQLMIDMNLEHYCFDLQSLNISDLLSSLQTVLIRCDEIRTVISTHAGPIREDLEHAFDQLAKIISSPELNSTKACQN